MAIDPSIALGVKPIEIGNPLTQYGQIAAIQNAQNQNALAQYQIESAKRTDAAQNALGAAYKQSLDPTTGEVDRNLLFRNLSQSDAAHLIPDVQAKLLEQQVKKATLGKTQVETEEKTFKLANDKLKHGWESLGAASTPQAAIEKLNDGVAKGYFDRKTADAEIQQLQNMPLEQYKQYRVQKILGLLDAKDQLAAISPKIARQDIGGQITNIQDNPLLPGYGLPVQGMAAIAKTMTPGEVASNAVALRNAATNAGQLGLAQARFAWEKANPGYELKEDAAGNLFGVNKRTLQAMPVMVGGAGAPAAAPGAVPAAAGPRVATPTAAPAQVIPGMRSVLDQAVPTAAPAAAPAAAGLRQFKAQSAALTESQGNATAYGMRMLEANRLLSDLESKKVTSGGRVKGFVEGTLTSLVPYQGENLAAGAGSVMNAVPGVLGGPSGQQQQYQQAKENFITAVLRKESGASIAPSEFAREERKYFPQAGDTDDVIKQKQRAREIAIDAMKVMAGPGAKSIGGAAPSGIPGATANDPLGLGLGGR